MLLVITSSLYMQIPLLTASSTNNTSNFAFRVFILIMFLLGLITFACWLIMLGHRYFCAKNAIADDQIQLPDHDVEEEENS